MTISLHFEEVFSSVEQTKLYIAYLGIYKLENPLLPLRLQRKVVMCYSFVVF